ncbi:MAG TPA: FAD-dependent oxidoreductase [Gemmatimonadaceae bacterium]|jgi:thioredoxin reductase (NADPH)
MSTDLDIAFPTLAAAEIAGLRRFGKERPTTAGEVLFAEGDRGFCFFVVLEGEVEIIEHSSGAERVVTTHPANTFTGDVDQLTGRAALITARVRDAGRVLQLGAEALRRAVEELPEVGERVLKAFLARRALLLSSGFQGVKIIGSRYSPEAHQLRDFATRNQVPFTWIDLEQDAQAESLLQHFGVAASATPVVIARDGKMVPRPTLAQFAHCAGLEATLEPGRVFDLAIVGAGPAGLAAAVYAASEGLATVTFDATAAGGQAGTSSRIENYLGFPAGISGADLTRNALLQAQKFGAQVSVPDRVVKLRIENGYRVLVLESGAEIHARCVLVASGVEYRRLPIPRLAEFEGAGVYHAATEMEARICRGDDVVVVGAGNSAGQAIVYLSRFAQHVHVVLRGDDLGKSMSRYLVDRVEGIDNVTVHRACSVSAVDGDTRLRSLTLQYGDGRTENVDSSALFLFIGAAPHTSWLANCVQLDDKGFVLTGDLIPREAIAEPAWPAGRRPMLLETSLPGVFAAGDARSGSMKRVSAAVGEGAMAVSLVHAHLGAMV